MRYHLKKGWVGGLCTTIWGEMAWPISIRDPTEPSTIGTWRPPGSLPRFLRQFGKCPNVDEWLPGDVVLMSALKQGRMSRYIVKCQDRGGWEEADARWHHTAVYIGNCEVCEATVRGVKVSSLYDRYLTTHLLRVRRDPNVEMDKRGQSAIQSLRRLGKGYGFGTAMGVWSYSIYGFWKDRKSFIILPGKTVICSSLFAEAYSRATLKAMGNTDHSIPTPAFLSHTDLLQDIPLCWRSIQ